jgi:type I restriction enzyme M protein
MSEEYKPKIDKAAKPEEGLLDIGELKGYISISRDRGRITYAATGKSYSFKDPEEAVRAQLYVELIEKYKYPPDRIDTEIQPPRREPKLPADLVVYEKMRNKGFICVEVKAEEGDRKIEEAKREGLGNATLLDAQYLLLACGSERLAYDVYKKPPLEELEKYRIADIPVAYGKEPEFKYRKGDSQWDLRKVSFNELEQKFQLCHDRIWEGGKRDPAIAFDEMSKLMFTKIYDERFTKNGEYYRFQIGTHEEQRDVARRMKEIYSEIQEKETEVFKGEIELPDLLLFRLVEILQDLSFSRTDLDVKGRAFEKFLGMLFRGEYGQYFTRREIVEFMVDMLEPTKDDIVLDPACGSGGFLLYAMDRVRRKAEKDYQGDQRAIDEIYWYFPVQNIFGIEVNDRIARIAMMDMVIHEDGHTNIENNDSLSDPSKFNPKRDIRLGKYTLLMTNPPFGAKAEDPEILSQYELGSKQRLRKSQRTEILFIERCLDYLRPGGRMGIVLPDGILTNSSLQYVRDFIDRKAKVLAIVSLPQSAFVPVGAGVKASLVFLQKKRFDGQELGNYPIFMAIAEHIGYDATSRPDKNELPEILGEYDEFLQGRREFNPAFVVFKDDIKGKLDCFYYQPRFIENARRLSKSAYPLKLLGEIIANIRYGAYIEPKYASKGTLFLRATNIRSNDLDIGDAKFIDEIQAKRLANYLLQPGDILIVRSGVNVGDVACVDEAIAGSLHGSYSIKIRMANGINPKYVSVFLNSALGKAQIDRLKGRSAQPNISVPELKSIKIPLPPREIQDEIADIVDKAYKRRKEKLAEAKELVDYIEPYFLEQLGIQMPEMKEKRTFAVRLEGIKGKRLDPFHYRPVYDSLIESLEKGSYTIYYLGNITKLIASGQRPKGGVRHIESGVPSLGGEHINSEGGFNFSELKYVPRDFFDRLENAHLNPGDILMVKDGATTGKVAIVTNAFPYREACINEHVFRIVAEDKIEPYYLFAFLYSSLGQRQIQRLISGGAQKGITREAVGQIKIPLPPLKIQKQIAQEIKKRRRQAEALRSQAQKTLEEAKKIAGGIILGSGEPQVLSN